MTINHYIIIVFCFVVGFIKEKIGKRSIHTRGESPQLSNSEVITMEIVGEYLGLEKDMGILHPALERVFPKKNRKYKHK